MDLAHDGEPYRKGIDGKEEFRADPAVIGV